MQPAFHREHLAGFAASMRAAAEHLADRWMALPEGTIVDVDGAMLAASLEIVGDTLFSANLQNSAPGAGRRRHHGPRSCHRPLAQPGLAAGLAAHGGQPRLQGRRRHAR